MPVSEQDADRHVVQCNYASGTSPVAARARAYLVRANPGGGNDRIVVLARSRGGRWVERWEDIRRLENFRRKTLPPEHPMHGDARIWDAQTWRGDALAMAAHLTVSKALQAAERAGRATRNEPEETDDLVRE